MYRLVVLAITVLSGVAMAASREQSGGGCCWLVWIILFTAIYRSGGTDWARSIGTAIVPGLFGWFIWRDRGLTSGARWVALIFASLQVLGLVVGILAGLLAPTILSRLAASAAEAGQVKPGKDLSHLPEDPALGLHPLATVATVPSGATVFVNGQERGLTPLETPMTVGARNEVRVELAGYFTETRSQSPNAREHLVFSFQLKEAARLELSTTPPGARVLVGQAVIVDRTPGLADKLEPGQTDLLVLRDGYQPLLQPVTLTSGEQRLALTLEPGVKISVGSTPDQADVFVDGTWVGRSPLDVFVSPKGKHTIELKKEPFATASKMFTTVKQPAVFKVKLVDVERVAATQALARARARYDKLNDSLEKLQTRIEHMQTVPAKLEADLARMERDMEKAAGALELAEGKLKEVEEARGVKPPRPSTDDDDVR